MASNELFLLIHSLGKAEKRSFKLRASLDKKEKIYITLFALIEKQKKYDEKILIKKLGVSNRHFAVYKHHLYNLILTRISLFNVSKEILLRNMMTEADFLHSKGLYPSYEKMLRKIKAFAGKHEMHLHLLEVINMEHRNAWRNRNLKKALDIMEEDKIILGYVNNQRQYTQLSNEILARLSSMPTKQSLQESAKIKELMKNPLIKNEKNALTFRSKYSLYHTLSSYYYTRNNFQKQHYYAKKATELYENNPEKIKHDTFTYLLSLQLVLSSCHTLGKFDEGKKYIDKLRVDTKLLQNEREKTWAWFTFHDSNLNYYIRTGKFEEGITAVEILIKELNEYSSHLESAQNALLDFLITKIFFGTGNYGKCLFWLNKILNEKYTLNIRPGIENTIRILYLIVHYEKGNFKLLSTLVKSTRQKLAANGKLHSYENHLLTFLAWKQGTKRESILEFENLKCELEATVKKEKILFDEFDYLAWIESKIENKSFAEVFRDKLRK